MSEIYCESDVVYAALPEPAPVRVQIANGRAAADLSWRTNGFERLDHVSAVDFDSPEDVQARHLDEIESLARSQQSCDAVLFYPPLIRSPDLARKSADLGPIHVAHSDYTENYLTMLRTPDHPYRALLRPSMERAGVTDEQLDALREVVTLQFWRNLGPVRPDFPLALCDGQSVDRASLMPFTVEEYAGQPTQFDSFLVSAADTHRWYTFPDLTRDEVLMFRAFDSELARTGSCFWTPHCAFADPHAATGAERKSIEMRAICLSF